MNGPESPALSRVGDEWAFLSSGEVSKDMKH